MKPSKKVYIGSVIFNTLLSYFLFAPIRIGWSLIRGLFGEVDSSQVFMGALIWFCVLITVVMMECVVYYVFRDCKLKKKKFFLTVIIPFVIVTGTRIIYSVLQTWG